MTHRPAIATPPLDCVRGSPQQSLAAPAFGFPIAPGEVLFHRLQGFPSGPAVQHRVGYPTPPDRIGEAPHLLRVACRQGHHPLGVRF
jgi:hypothetical protein